MRSTIERRFLGVYPGPGFGRLLGARLLAAAAVLRVVVRRFLQDHGASPPTSRAPAWQLYGSFGIGVAALVWVYYSSIIFVLGAELAAILGAAAVLPALSSQNV